MAGFRELDLFEQPLGLGVWERFRRFGQPVARHRQPFERLMNRQQALVRPQMAGLAAAALPLAGCGLGLAQRVQVVGTFGDPVTQPRPLAKQRFVRDFDHRAAFAALAADQQPRVDEGVEQRRRFACRGEARSQHPPARRDAAFVYLDEVGEDLQQQVLRCRRQVAIGRLGAATDRAADAAEAHRDRLFGATPLVMAALDERLARSAALRANDAAVVGKVDLPRLIENILQVLPETETIAIVIGASRLECFWFGELQREFAPFAARVKFLWLNDLPLDKIQERVASLPPHSAILYVLMIVDAAGVPYERQDALASLKAVANAPIFSIYESELGKGVVGGPYTSQRRHGREMAEASHGILSGAERAKPQLTVMTLPDTPDHESHDRFPHPRPSPRCGRGEMRESLARLSH